MCQCSEAAWTLSVPAGSLRGTSLHLYQVHCASWGTWLTASYPTVEEWLASKGEDAGTDPKPLVPSCVHLLLTPVSPRKWGGAEFWMSVMEMSPHSQHLHRWKDRGQLKIPLLGQWLLTLVICYFFTLPLFRVFGVLCTHLNSFIQWNLFFFLLWLFLYRLMFKNPINFELVLRDLTFSS